MAEEQGHAGRPLTLGEQRVRISFNPNQVPHVVWFKRQAADFIDYCETLRALNVAAEHRHELQRLLSLAQTHAEDAAMWAVKGATIGLP